MQKYLEGEELTERRSRLACVSARIANEMLPVLCGSAFKNKGVQAMLDAVIEFMPSPTEMPPVKGLMTDGGEGHRAAADDETFSALAFKITQ